MSNSGINFKAYYVDGDNSEVKRFFVDSDTVTSFIFMEEKLKCVFPSLRNSDFKINWKDADGDLISISNDEDFITALTEMNYNPKVLYVNATSKNSAESSRAFRVICDICQKGISGYRYKCIECPNYDLCSTCEGSGNHSEHMVLRLPNSNTSFGKLDKKMMYNAARALKKSTILAHKCTRESSKAGEKEKNCGEESGTSTTHAPSYGCPFAASDINTLLTQNISPFMEMLSKGPQTSSNTEQSAQNPLSDLIRSVMEAFTGSVITDPNATSEPTAPSNTSQKTKPDSATGVNTEQQDSTAQTKQTSQQTTTHQPSAPTANATNNSQDMEWTIVSDSEDSASQASSKTPTAQPPQPPQDPRLMRGLAQLHEMGFSNENNFLNYLLELHDYNVASVVKAILQLK